MKTLKDLRHPRFKWKYIDRKKLVSIIELKEEAIKWIKSLDNASIETGYDDNNGQLQDWIMEFFNLKEEDLENKEGENYAKMDKSGR